MTDRRHGYYPAFVVDEMEGIRFTPRRAVHVGPMGGAGACPLDRAIRNRYGLSLICWLPTYPLHPRCQSVGVKVFAGRDFRLALYVRGDQRSVGQQHGDRLHMTS